MRILPSENRSLRLNGKIWIPGKILRILKEKVVLALRMVTFCTLLAPRHTSVVQRITQQNSRSYNISHISYVGRHHKNREDVVDDKRAFASLIDI